MMKNSRMLGRSFAAAVLVPTLLLLNACSFAGDSGSSGEIRLAGFYVCFEEGELQLRRGILTLKDGFIAEISDDKAGMEDVVYLDPECVMLPGLIDLHSHPDYNGLQIWKTDETDVPWDNRFEWRKSADYMESLKNKFLTLEKEWEDVVYPENEDLSAGDLISYFVELQAAAGGTTLMQGYNDSEDTYDIADSHEKLGVIRSTASGKDLMREEGMESVNQLYMPDAELSPEQPESYLPPIDTSSWNIVHVVDKVTGEDVTEKFFRDIREHSRRGYLIHIAEGRAGNLTDTTDAYSKQEFDTFRAEIEERVSRGDFTAEDVKNAHLALIHACAIDLSDAGTITFLKEYGISLIWSPVSNLLLYEDTPDFYSCLNNPDLKVALGSDWSPSGSKTVWEEAAFVYETFGAQDRDDKDIREDLLRACTLTPAEIVGESRLGNIVEGAFADLLILRADRAVDGDLDAVLDAFAAAEDRQMEGVIIGGKAVCGEREFLIAFTGDVEPDCYGTYKKDSPDEKMYIIPELFGDKTLPELYESFLEIMNGAEIELSGVRSSEDPAYEDAIKELVGETVRALS